VVRTTGARTYRILNIHSACAETPTGVPHPYHLPTPATPTRHLLPPSEPSTTTHCTPQLCRDFHPVPPALLVDMLIMEPLSVPVDLHACVLRKRHTSVKEEEGGRKNLQEEGGTFCPVATTIHCLHSHLMGGSLLWGRAKGSDITMLSACQAGGDPSAQGSQQDAGGRHGPPPYGASLAPASEHLVPHAAWRAFPHAARTQRCSGLRLRARNGENGAP